MCKVAEETTPAEAECGMRRVSVTAADGSRVVIQIMQEKQGDDCSGEIHPAQEIVMSRDVVTNQQLTHALLQIASVSVRFSNSTEV